MRKLLTLLLLAPCALLAQVPDYVPTDGLVAWYPMNGNAIDESGNGYDCQSIGATMSEDRFGAPSSAYSFDGQGSHLQGSSLPFSDLSISLWFKAEAGVFETYSGGTPPTGAQLIGQGTTHSPCSYCDWAIGISDWSDGVDNLAWEKANSSPCQVQQTASNWEPELEEWTHLAAVSEGTDVSFYINGNWVSTIPFDQPFQQGGSILSIGSRYVENCNGGGNCTGPDNAWSGSIDDVAVWNRTLSTEEINALYGASNTTILPDYVPSEGLVAYWPLDGNATNAYGTDYDGVIAGATPTIDRHGEENSAFAFDGVDDRITIPNDFDFTALTVSAWFYRSSQTSSYQAIVDRSLTNNIGWWIEESQVANEHLFFNGGVASGNYFTTAASLPEFGEWTHVCAIYEAGHQQLYLNGVLTSTDDNALPLQFPNANLYIGSRTSGAWFHGAIDDVGIWDRALSAEDVGGLFESGADSEVEANQALDFPGIDVTPFSESGVMEVPYDPALDRTGSQPFTIAADVLLEDGDLFQLFHTGQDGDPENNITFGLSDSQIRFFWENQGVNYELIGDLSNAQLGPLATSQWHHIAASWNGTTLALYINGLEIVTDNPNEGPGETADRSFYWASLNGGNSLNGQLDNVQFWTIGLTQLEVIDFMNCPPIGVEPGLEGYWTFDGPDASVALDITGNGHDGNTLGLSRLPSTRPACSSGGNNLFGCSDSQACNYNDDALFDNGTCIYGCQFCGENTLWDSLLLQCVSMTPAADTVFVLQEVSIPSCGPGTVWDPINEMCIVAIPADLNFDGCVTVGDLLQLLTVHGTCPPYPEWPDFPGDTSTTGWSCGNPLPYQGYDYATVQIGDQCWFAESLQATETLDGADLEVGTPGNWPDFQDGTGAWMHPENDPSLSHYGLLYNWHATAQGEGMCPSGWHLPSDEEWKELEVQLDIDAAELDSFGWHGTIQGAELKSSAEWNGTNTHYFGAVPSGGVHADQGYVSSYGSEVWFWTSSTLSTDEGKALFRSLSSGESRVQRHHTFKNHGGSIRCLKD